MLESRDIQWLQTIGWWLPFLESAGNSPSSGTSCHCAGANMALLRILEAGYYIVT
ncbi:hypothetical protein P152DRAFT_454660 [Eremomyces bilateralis CBS 781.70]|uniref:Uncharacterized protein n=1 Tax=Eremomyces bilateralis CBS 781.70 TaxID=1392243 RepID=A0A6G1GEE3_9PEZI|nr:uncharacterized protein P152DRAFT_454660 [Eremomyces bilateralis CBS 781.70]KAF1816392.1 hypothetical protein P152DRAFT_454660 [Eremomyces bilateralis CBS 781.70]